MGSPAFCRHCSKSASAAAAKKAGEHLARRFCLNRLIKLSYYVNFAEEVTPLNSILTLTVRVF